MLTSPLTTTDAERFLLFGIGPHRPKLVYQHASLRDARTGEVRRTWNPSDLAHERYEPSEYRVLLRLRNGEGVTISEDAAGMWLDDKSGRACLSSEGIPALPRFDGPPQAPLLRALHHELLVNIAEADRGGGPLPNLFVYDKPWFRDAAMVALCLERTGNLALLAPFTEHLRAAPEPYDRNNKNHAEPDNLGQVLTLIALSGGDASHPLVQKALESAEAFRPQGFLTGLSDFAPHPVYQTKWLKYGLKRLGLPDAHWHIPAVQDSYSALFWMDYTSQHVPDPGFDERSKTRYPYLGWAEAHFHGVLPPGLLPTADTFPLTWEAHASEADYRGMTLLGASYSAAKICTPHTWHGAEMFLCLLDLGATSGATL